MTKDEPLKLAMQVAAEYKQRDSQIDSGNLYHALCECIRHIDAQQVKR